MKNMLTSINAHGVDTLSIKPVQRVESSTDLGYFFAQHIEVENDHGERTTFSIFFSDAVNKKKEQDRLADERAAAQDQATAMEYLENKSSREMLDL